LTIRLAPEAAQQIKLEITDTGRGMDADTKDQIFTPFFTTKAAEEGTGLGLYIVRNIIKNHDASIRCESEPDKGTSFTILFREDQRSA
jgi:signal transduction histidine kinase